MPDTPEVRAIRLGANLPQGTDVYVALALGSLGNGGVELTLTGYARIAIDDWTTTVPTPGTSERANTAKVTFPLFTSAGSTDNWGIYDSSVGGVLLNSGEILNGIGLPVIVPVGGVGGDNVQFLPGDLVIRDQQV